MGKAAGPTLYAHDLLDLSPDLGIGDAVAGRRTVRTAGRRKKRCVDVGAAKGADVFDVGGRGPDRLIILRISVFCSRRWVAKLCRSV